MFRLFIVVLIGFTIFSIYTDITKGTIPTTAQSQETQKAISSLQKNDNTAEEKLNDSLYMIVEIKAGDTVLTIAERITNGPIPVPINKLIEDFQLLNDNVIPEKIQIGREYKFPIYR
ncbi:MULTISPECIES: hypothetical protein [Bacillus]|uniref:hypothetical protein n=1 Tax=Bacillus TaxID=1386 RepID=UPI000BB7283F|nr:MULTISPECIES: hypothetical protein [Bacillus]